MRFQSCIMCKQTLPQCATVSQHMQTGWLLLISCSLHSVHSFPYPFPSSLLLPAYYNVHVLPPSLPLPVFHLFPVCQSVCVYMCSLSHWPGCLTGQALSPERVWPVRLVSMHDKFLLIIDLFYFTCMPTTQYGWTPIISAALEGRCEVVIELLNNGADVNAQNDVS